MIMATTEIAKMDNDTEAVAQMLVQTDTGPMDALLNVDKFEQLQRCAKLFSSSDLVPEQFRGKVANCFIGLQMALRLGVEPFMFLQNCYIVHGKPGIESKLAIALANSRGVFRGGIRYEMFGEGKTRGCIAYGTHAKTGDRCEATCDMALATAEGWTKKSGSKWLTMPELMLKYRAAMFLIRTHCPEVIMGLQSVEELADIEERTAARLESAVRLIDNRSKSDRLADSLGGDEPADEQEPEAPKDAETPKGSLFTDNADMTRYDELAAGIEAGAYPDPMSVIMKAVTDGEIDNDEAEKLRSMTETA